MNSKQRVRMAFSHQEPDRVPVSELYINSPAASQVIGRKAFTGWGGDIICAVRCQYLMEGRAKEFYHREVEDLVDCYRKLDLDTILIERPPLKNPVIPTFVAENMWKFEDAESGLWHVLHHLPESDQFYFPDSNFHSGGLDEFRRFVELLEKDPLDLDRWDWSQAEYIVSHCPDKFIMAVVEIDFPPMSMGSLGGLFLEAMSFEPELCERYLDYRVRKGKKFIEKYAAMGVDCVFDGEDLAGKNGPLFSPAYYNRFYKGRFQELIEQCHRNNMLYLRHTDGNVMPFAREFLVDTGIDGYQSIDPSAGMDLAHVKKVYGDKILLMGNVDCAEVLHLGTKEDVVRDTKRVLATASPGGGHILSSSNTIHSAVPFENFMCMLETARTYGTYPIDLDALKATPIQSKVNGVPSASCG